MKHATTFGTALRSCLLLISAAATSIAMAQAAPATEASHASSPAAGMDKTASDTVMRKSPITPDSFMTMAAQDGMAEVEMAKLALRKAKAPEIKSFAQQMQRDHEAVNTQVKSLAAAKHVNLPTGLDTEHQKMLEELAAKSGTEFDAAYATHMAAAHAKAIALFQQAATSGDPDVMTLASKTLPTLHAHQQMATQLKQQFSSGKAVSRNTAE